MGSTFGQDASWVPSWVCPSGRQNQGYAGDTNLFPSTSGCGKQCLGFPTETAAPLT